MKTSFAHIPEKQKKELDKIVKLIKQVSKKVVTVEMIILYGSYARGDFVEEDITFYEGHHEEYKSDFDLLLITRNSSEKNTRLLIGIEKSIQKETSIVTPVSIIVEHIGHINARLEENRYFYLDIKREGIVLYDSERCKLKDAKTLTRIESTQLKKEDYALWFGDALNSLKKYSFTIKEGMLRESAFELHQASERFFTAYLLVKTGYKPKTHDLKILHEMSVKNDSVFLNWFNFTNLEENRYFELLRKAYVESRYSKNYSITCEELLFLESRILYLQELSEELCKKEI